MSFGCVLYGVVESDIPPVANLLNRPALFEILERQDAIAVQTYPLEFLYHSVLTTFVLAEIVNLRNVHYLMSIVSFLYL